MTPTRLPPLTQDEYRALCAKLIAAGQILASSNYRLPSVSARELIERIQGKDKG